MSRPAPAPINDSPTEWVRDHITRYVSSNGADGHDWNGVPCMLLTTKGRRSGTWQRSALIYGIDPDTNDVIITEFGAAEIAGLSISERAHALARISHPDFREELLSTADVWPSD